MKKLIIANWKLNPKILKEGERLFAATAKAARAAKNVDVVVCPPFPYLTAPGMKDAGAKRGAQNVAQNTDGAHTGEVAASMIKSVGASYVIVGHSERREQFGETNEAVQAKVKAALAAGLAIIVCVGERSRDDLEYMAFVKDEVREGLRGIPKRALARIIVAYEPIWAIGADEPDTPENTFEMATFIRRIVFDMFGKEARRVPVLYGGSVNAKNAGAFLERGGVDGLLVGRASLKVKEFANIIRACSKSNV